MQIDRGCLFTVDFTVPEYAAPGDLYPIGFAYVDDGIVSDCFISSDRNEAAKIQMTYLFTRGIHNGYIKIIGEKQTTTTTAAEPLWGDVDCSGDITLADAVLLYRIAAEDPCDGVSLTEHHIAAADCDSDNAITLLECGEAAFIFTGRRCGSGCGIRLILYVIAAKKTGTPISPECLFSLH